jgi:hypothetical protein
LLEKSRLALWILVLTAVVLPSCQQVINNPKPVLNTISPTSVAAGSPAFLLTVNGNNFAGSNSLVEVSVNGSAPQPRITKFDNTSQLTAKIFADDIQAPGTIMVTVITPPPGGGTSLPQTFTVTPSPSPTPTVTSITPSGVFVNSVTSSLSVIVTGTHFVSQSIVTVNGNNCTAVQSGNPTGVPGCTTPLPIPSSTSITASIPSTFFVGTGTLSIGVLNPPPGGGASNTVLLNITNPFPNITAVTPTSIQAGSSSGAALTVAGTGFAPASVILINGGQRPTTTSSRTQLTTALSAGDLAAAGVNQVQVFNPAPGGGTSNILTFAIDPTPAAGLPELVDVANDGSQGDTGICGACPTGGLPDLTTAGPSTDSTGAFIAYASTSSDLIANDGNSSSDVFVRTTCLVASGTSSACVPVNSLASVSATGGPANGPSFEPSLDAAGAQVAFTSNATNLVNTVAFTGTDSQVYWNVVCASSTTGCGTTPTTALVSISADGTQPGNGASFNPAISPDGRYVAFVSLATNLVSNLSFNGATPQVFLGDTCNGQTIATSTSPGCVPQTFLVSTLDGVTPANAASSNPSVSNDGESVSFTSSATNLGAPAANVSQVYVRTTCVNVSSGCTPATTLVSTPDGVSVSNGPSGQSTITSDGRFVAFASTATNLVSGVGPTQQIYVRDTCNGQLSTCSTSTTLVSTANGITPANALSEHPSISQGTSSAGEGQFIAFASFASNLSANAANGRENIFVRNTCTNAPTTGTTTCSPSTALSSIVAGTSPSPANGNSIAPSISSDGHVVSFISSANNLVARDNNGIPDIFLGTTTF